MKPSAEQRRLAKAQERGEDWKRWGPYLSERQWGTVREDYSPTGTSWADLPHEHARSRAYRWGEDGLLGLTDRQCRLCFSIALHNGKDRILKERLFGLTGPEGNHGEDVKECYHYLEATPTSAYLKALYKYPQCAFPYEELLAANRGRSKHLGEFEIRDTAAFQDNRYFDVVAEYAKAAPEDILIRLTLHNRGPEVAAITLLPTLWFRNTWAWGCQYEGCRVRPYLRQSAPGVITAHHESLGTFLLTFDRGESGEIPEILFTDNETNKEALFGVPSDSPYTKDAFHRYVISKETQAVRPEARGTKAAGLHQLTIAPRSAKVVKLRLTRSDLLVEGAPFGPAFDRCFEERIEEADAFYRSVLHPELSPDEHRIARQSHAGLIFSRQFYHIVVENWLDGDAEPPPPPTERKEGRNRDWRHLYSRDVLSMPDKWEYPWFAAWDLAFHMIPCAQTDPDFAKEQLLLLLREWYMHPNGQIPAYEFNFGDVNPPVHAWACWRVYKITAPRGARDLKFLARCFQKLLLNFTWWVNRKDLDGNHIFTGGFLGLDNIGVFDRSKPLPTGGHLQQADGTAWMAFYATTMLAMAIELAIHDSTYEDIASKFFEHFVSIADAMNRLGGTGLWDPEDGFYYDQLHLNDRAIRLRSRSLVGIVPLFAVLSLNEDIFRKLPEFAKRTAWFLENRPDLAQQVSYLHTREGQVRKLLAIPCRSRLERVLRYVFDESEFLSPFGIRSLSRFHLDHPFRMKVNGDTHEVAYVPGESDSWMFGGNSNWRGPVWFPMNFLLIETLEQYHYYYGDDFKVEVPTGSGQWMTLAEASREIARRLLLIFLPGGDGRRPCHGEDTDYANDPHWKDLLLFHEYFHADTGRGLGASHQTGWTALVANIAQDVAKARHLGTSPELERLSKTTLAARFSKP
jgi:hypothetical protein